MTKHVAHRNRDDDWMYSEKHVKAGKELAAMFNSPRRVPDLSWPRSLFTQQPLTIEELMAQDRNRPRTFAAPRLKQEDYCQCGQPHRQAVSWTRRSDTGFGWNLTWFCGNTCKDRAVRHAA